MASAPARKPPSDHHRGGRTTGATCTPSAHLPGAGRLLPSRHSLPGGRLHRAVRSLPTSSSEPAASCIVAGSGVVPNFSILKTPSRSPRLPHLHRCPTRPGATSSSELPWSGWPPEYPDHCAWCTPDPARGPPPGVRKGAGERRLSKSGAETGTPRSLTCAGQPSPPWDRRKGARSRNAAHSALPRDHPGSSPGSGLHSGHIRREAY